MTSTASSVSVVSELWAVTIEAVTTSACPEVLDGIVRFEAGLLDVRERESVSVSTRIWPSSAEMVVQPDFRRYVDTEIAGPEVYDPRVVQVYRVEFTVLLVLEGSRVHAKATAERWVAGMFDSVPDRYGDVTGFRFCGIVGNTETEQPNQMRQG